MPQVGISLSGSSMDKVEIRPWTADWDPGLIISARALADAYGRDYSLEQAPRSPNGLISGNRTPGTTRLSWLKNRYKCNQFVGDVLTLAGYEMPTYKMSDGSLHYVNAEALPRFSKHFERISKLEDLRPGDLLVIDRLSASGENGAHVEIVSEFSKRSGRLSSIGAHKQGAYESTRAQFFVGLSKHRESQGAYWQSPASKVYLLRPSLGL